MIDSFDRSQESDATLAIAKSRELASLYPAAPAHAFFRTMELMEYAGKDLRDPVVDLGCGEGRFALLLFGMSTNKVIGIDLSLDDLQKARGLRVHDSLVLADIRVLPIRPKVIRTFVSNSVLEHVPRFESAVGEVARCLELGGFFYSSFVTENILLWIAPLPSRSRDGGLKTKFVNLAIETYNRLYSLRQENFVSAQSYSDTLARTGLRVVRTNDLLSKRALLVWHCLHLVALITRLISAMGFSNQAGEITRAAVAWGFRRSMREPRGGSMANIFVEAERVESGR